MSNFMQLKHVKELFRAAFSMEEYVDTAPENEPKVILRDYDEPAEPPCLEEGIELFDFERNQRPSEDVREAYGTRSNIPGIQVVNALKAALGPGNYRLHISDKSYTGYSIWELREYMKNFDSTNLRVWISEVFDCDDFSQVLQGNVNGFFPGIAFGTIWYGPKKPPYNWGHSVNIFYSHNTTNKIYLVEPQNDSFYLFDQNKWRAWMVIL